MKGFGKKKLERLMGTFTRTFFAHLDMALEHAPRVPDPVHTFVMGDRPLATKGL